MSRQPAAAGSLHILPTAEGLADAAAAAVADVLAGAVGVNGRALFVLAGGSTPSATYDRLARPPVRERVPWDGIEFFFGDERCVPPDDPASNHRLAREKLLAPLGIDPDRIHRIAGELPGAQAARLYEQGMRAGGSAPRFDLVLLGLGEDGHTASLFPGSPVLHEDHRLVRPAVAPVAPRRRVTLTPAALRESRHTVFLVSGRRKAGAVAHALGGGDDENREDTPVARVWPRDGDCVWFMDAAAATLLSPGPSTPRGSGSS